jgi:hypothetical protein
LSVIFNYSFSLTSPDTTRVDRVVEYSYNEFLLDLPEHWQPATADERNRLNWVSSRLDAAITVSVDFYEIPEEKLPELAEFILSSRTSALQQLGATEKDVLSRSIKPHSGGIGLELSLVAQLPDSTHQIYLGYVTSRKIFNFALTCSKANREGAAAMFNDLMQNLRVQLP